MQRRPRNALLALVPAALRRLEPPTVFRALHDDNLLGGPPRDAFTERLTYYLGEVNAIHPFREGNGRALRTFFDQLASDAGFILDWQHLDADRNIAASAAIMRGDPTPMRKMLDELVREP
jgi:cell filamentation protein